MKTPELDKLREKLLEEKAQLAAERIATYSVGDYVYAMSLDQDTHQVARIASATPRLSLGDRVFWMVNVGVQGKWTITPVERRVSRALSSSEVRHMRKLGLIPRPGDERKAGSS
jgi:hypothetical protein